MKLAVLHNFMDNIGGAEVVGLIMAREFDADVYSTVFNEEKIKKMGFSPRCYPIGWIPVNAPFRQQLALARFRYLNLNKKYDYYIIDGDWAVGGAVKNAPSLWWAHSPIREIWDLYEYTRQNSVSPHSHFIFDAWVRFNRMLTSDYVKKVTKLTCSSKNARNRIWKYLHREARVIYPPVETDKYYNNAPGNYWLSVNRLVSHKRVMMQLEAFRKLPHEKLIVVGSYEQSRHFLQYAQSIFATKPENVEIKSWVDASELRELYANCRGLITTAIDEDFGLTPVEAMASGKPVIAAAEGGYLETIIDGKTGFLIDDINAIKLREAIISLKRPEDFRNDCIAQAQNFSTAKFVKTMTETLNE
ncbi:MAG: glycosyltransferase [Deltaproteobacteria bacterium]|nr:glycosyltransferase [Deltaproteobacteria bacterium]